jgi:cell division transport system permease protein
MDQQLHGLLAHALDDEPLPPPADLARSAMAHGTTLRRRRQMRVGGIAGGALVATLIALNLAVPGRNPAPSTESAALPVPGASHCVPLSDVAIYLRPDVTEKQRAGLQARLGSDPRVLGYSYESREEAFQKFTQLWRDSPDMVKSMSPAQLPETFQVRLTAASTYQTFAAEMGRVPGIGAVTPDHCPTGPGESGTGGAPAGSGAEVAQ